jgi:hypothetical protein
METQGYPSSYPVIATILNFNKNNFLRRAQFEALETYWYLRLVKNTPNSSSFIKNTSRQGSPESSWNFSVRGGSDDLLLAEAE